MARRVDRGYAVRLRLASTARRVYEATDWVEWVSQSVPSVLSAVAPTPITPRYVSGRRGEQEADWLTTG